MHYGHHDVFDKIFHISVGSIGNFVSEYCKFDTCLHVDFRLCFFFLQLYITNYEYLNNDMLHNKIEDYNNRRRLTFTSHFTNTNVLNLALLNE
jgi:hypothetical protein